MTDTTPTPPVPDAELRQRIETAIRQAAHVCGEDCPAPDEAACHAAHPVQEAVSFHGVVTDVYGPISALVEVLLPLLAARDAQTRAQALREGADLIAEHPGPHHDELQPDEPGFWWDSRDKEAAADLLRARADGIHRGQA